MYRPPPRSAARPQQRRELPFAANATNMLYLLKLTQSIHINFAKHAGTVFTTTGSPEPCSRRHRAKAWVTCPAMAVKWLDKPEAHDYDAAAAYLSMLAEPAAVEKTVAALKTAKPVYQKAKDILRAAGLALLPETNAHVRSDLGKISGAERLSPILLVRGSAVSGYPLQIADGYHRVCASYVTDENTNIPCHLVSWQ